jgi:hypothetical protein
MLRRCRRSAYTSRGTIGLTFEVTSGDTPVEEAIAALAQASD